MKINGGTPEDTITAQTLLLRRMNHREWLVQFSEALLAQYRRPDGTTVPMTPFRTGAVNRLKLAAEYVKLLESDLRASERDLAKALAALKHHMGEPPHDP